MRNCCVAILVAILMTADTSMHALQTGQSAAGSSTPSILNGAVLYAELSKTIDAKKAKPGDPVTAQLVADVVSHGKIVAPHDAKLRGYVTEVQAYSKENPESRLGIAFDKVVLKGGQEIPFHSTLLAIRPAPPLLLNAGVSVPPGPHSGADSSSRYPYSQVSKGSMPKMSSPANNDMRPAEMKGVNQGIAAMGPTDIDGLSLSSASSGSGQAIVCFKHTVKLESGVRFELRVN